MSLENEEFISLSSSEQQNNIDFPVILRPHSFSSSSRNYSLRRNTPFTQLNYRKSNDIRVVSRRGRIQVYFKKIPQKSIQYAKDLWNTLVNMQWRWLILIVAIVNMAAYLTCGTLFYIDAWISGDLANDLNHTLCLEGIQQRSWNFFMLGIETITTTGYGYLHPTENCDIYFIVLTFSTMVNILIDGAFVSVVYAKLNKAKDRSIYGHIFSKRAVICLRNRQLCLIVRVNDKEERHWINSDVRMYLLRAIKTPEGESIPNHITELDLNPFGMLFWPLDISHEIGRNSPLWDVSAKDLMTCRLELIVVVTGSSVKTGQSTRSQTSYISKEIMWGYQFSTCLEYNTQKSEYSVSKKLFHHTVPQDVPLCSAKVLLALQTQVRVYRQSLDLSILNANQSTDESVQHPNEL